MRNAALLTALIYSLSGCAALTMSSPKSSSPADPPRCSEARGAVVIDGIFAGLYGLGGVALLAADEGGLGLLVGSLAAIHVASAVAGNRSATRCTKAHEAHEAWLESGAPRPSFPVDTEVAMGAAGSACYPNETCNPGLTCDQTSNLCIVPRPAPGQPDTSAPPDSTTADSTTADRPSAPAPAAPPAGSQPAQPRPASDRPAAPPSRAERPGRQPTPPRSHEPWGDFWREVK
jgi:hypothetical protein